MRVDKSKVKKILFITLSNIGDIVLTTPAMRVLHENFPGASIDVMAGPNGIELFKGHPAVHDAISYDKHISLLGKTRLIRRLRKAKYDLVVDMRNSFFPFLIGAKYRTGFMRAPSAALTHKKQQHIQKLSSIGLDVADAPFYLYVSKEDGRQTDKIMAGFDKNKPLVAISPGAKSEIKKWLKENYTKLTERLVKELNAQVVMVGDTSDSSLVKDIIVSAGEGITDLSGKTTLCQLASVLSRCRLLITNDSAPLHIAEAAGTKVLAIFGPTDHRHYGPTGSEDRVVRKDVFCSPCGRAQCRFNHECMRNIKVDDVFEIAKGML